MYVGMKVLYFCLGQAGLAYLHTAATTPTHAMLLWLTGRDKASGFDTAIAWATTTRERQRASIPPLARPPLEPGRINDSLANWNVNWTSGWLQKREVALQLGVRGERKRICVQNLKSISVCESRVKVTVPGASPAPLYPGKKTQKVLWIF